MCACVQVVKNNLSPTWKKFTVPLQTFCSSDLDRPLKVLTNQITRPFKTTDERFRRSPEVSSFRRLIALTMTVMDLTI